MFQNMDQETPGKTPKLEHQETSSQTLQMDEGCSWLFSVFFLDASTCQPSRPALHDSVLRF